MTCDELLYELRILLYEGNVSQASDLLTEYIYSLPHYPQGFASQNIGTLSSGSADEIISRLRKIFEASSLLPPLEEYHHSNEDTSLNNSDFGHIERVAQKLEINIIHYVLDEEFTPENVLEADSSERDREDPSFDENEEQLPEEMRFWRD